VEKIRQNQVFMLFILFEFTSFAFLIPHLIELSGYSSWVGVILGGAGGLLIIYYTVVLARLNPDRFFIHWGDEIVGKVPHILFSAIICFFAFNLASFLLREFNEFIIQNYLPTTPNWALAFSLGICIAVGVRSGVESIFRFAQFTFFISLIAFVFNPLLLSNEMGTNMYRGVALLTNHSFRDIWNGSMFMTPIFGEFFIILMIYPRLAQNKNTLKTLCWALIGTASIMLTELLPVLLVLGDELAANLTYPLLDTLRFIHIGDFLENLDPLIVAIWTISFYVKICLLLHCSIFGVAQLLSLKDYRPLSFSFTGLMIGYSILMVENMAEIEYLLKHVKIAFWLTVELIPLVYLMIYGIKKVWRKRKEDSQTQGGVSEEISSGEEEMGGNGVWLKEDKEDGRKETRMGEGQ
jgi:spore germination protein KB